MNNKLMIKKLQDAGVEFAPGLSGEEFRWIEETYGFRFPSEIRDFFAFALPVSHGFYNWRDKTWSTTNKI